MDKIVIKGLRIFAYHGVNPEEKEKGQPFVLDITLYKDLSLPGATDDLNDTVNYSRVAEAVLAEFPVREVTVRLKKPRAPIAGDFEYVAVEITRRAPEAVV